jgi:hypothetical protein
MYVARPSFSLNVNCGNNAMNKRTAAIAVPFLIGLCALLVFFYRANEDANQPDAPARLGHPRSSRPQTQQATAHAPSLAAARFPYLDRFRNFEGFLDSNGHSPESLTAVYCLTGSDTAIEALEADLAKAPTYGVQAILCRTSRGDSKKDVLALVDKALNLHPGNRELSFLRMGLLGSNGDLDSTRNAIKAFRANDSLDFGEKERYKMIREAILSTNVDVAHAWTDGYLAETNCSNSLAYTASGAIAALKNFENIPEDSKLQIATGLVHIAKQINPHEDYTDSSAWRVSEMLEESALKRLPPDYEYGENGTTVADSLAGLRLIADKSNLMEEKLKPFLFSQPPAVVQMFLERRESDGIGSAIYWLENKYALEHSEPK